MKFSNNITELRVKKKEEKKFVFKRKENIKNFFSYSKGWWKGALNTKMPLNSFSIDSRASFWWWPHPYEDASLIHSFDDFNFYLIIFYHEI